MSHPSLLILAGDGIGPEVMAQVKRIIGWYGDKRDMAFDVSEDLVGGADETSDQGFDYGDEEQEDIDSDEDAEEGEDSISEGDDDAGAVGD